MALVSQLKAVKDMVDAAATAATVAAGSADNAAPFAWERDFTGYRTPMVVTSTHWDRLQKQIRLFVNPREMTWNLAKRETVSKTAAGAIRNAWRNRYRGTYYDEPTINITFQTGNMMPGAGVPSYLFKPGYADVLTSILRHPPVPPGIEDFYDFLELIDQPMLDQNNRENRHILRVNTRLFPRITLEGYFTQDPITFVETADAANSVTWNATFMVYKTSPKIWGRNAAEGLRNAYSNAILNHGAMSELLPQSFDLAEFNKYWATDKGATPDDQATPYKTTKLDSGTTRKKKKVGLVATPPGKTATPTRNTSVAGDLLQPSTVDPNEEMGKQALAATTKILGDYKAAGDQPGTRTDETITQTEYWPQLQAAMNSQFASNPGDTPPTVEDINAFTASWMKQNMEPADLAKYDVLLHRLENP